MLTFFSLTPEEASIYRNNVFTQIHEIVFHSKGGYDWYVVYNMPLPIRLFTWSKLKQWFDEQNKTNSEDTVAKSIETMKAVGAKVRK